jgi:hypothetical protein
MLGFVRRLLSLALVILPLGACSRELDQFSPQIVITRPRSDITPNSSVVIEGYAWDDKGINKLVLNGKTDLLAKGDMAAQRGRKVVRFKFAAKELDGNALKYELRAVDNARNSSSRAVTVVVDTKKPAIEIQNIDSQIDSIVVSGVARDNRKVQAIFVNGEQVNTSKGAEVSFYSVVNRTRARNIVIRALDGVGNEALRYLLVPAPPPPPEPVAKPAEDAPKTTTRRPRRRRANVTTLPAQVLPSVPEPSEPPPVGHSSP